MKSWRSWWTAIGMALAAQLSCGGESDESHSNSGSSNGTSGDAGRGGSSAQAGKGGKSGTAGKSSTAGTTNEAAGEGGETSVAGRASGGRTGSGGSALGGSGAGGSDVAGSAGTTGASAGIAGMGGTGNTVPFNWYCAFAKWGDGECDCGCGVRDKDCEEDYELDDCDTCDSPGSCNGGECPGRIKPENPALCTPPPLEWTCPDYAYWDFMYCDCGCGIPDPDCEGPGNDQCDKCNLVGSCSGSSNCPGSIDAEDNSQCDIPEGWNCSSIVYLDGDCDCGCGVLDPDCASAAASACENCWNGCAQTYCPGPIDAENNAICTGVPVAWRCLARFYADGSICNCGCGAPDPDCENDELASCDRCDAEGSCSARACPGTIDPTNVDYCSQPDPPEGWTCGAYAYADGYSCDCGCGAEDLDCRVNDIDECDRCGACGTSCPGRVNPEDPTDCIEPPAAWNCDDYLYGDGYSCTCGCGALDPDCADATVESCSHCPQYAGSCSREYCNDVNPEDNSRCNPTAPAGWNCDPDWYGDRACDCGCGVRDVDCSSASSSVCEICEGESCSPPGCAAIDPADNAICTGT